MVKLTFPVRLLRRQDLEDVYTPPAVGRLEDDLGRNPNFFSHASNYQWAARKRLKDLESLFGSDLRMPVLHNRIC